MLETDLNIIEKNARAIRKNVPGDKEILSVVKANAYGHGSVAVSKMLEERGLSDGFAVATAGEGIALRDGNIHGRIMILGYTDEQEMYEAVSRDIEVCVYSEKMLYSLSEAAFKSGKAAKAHLKIDTGMNRIGVKGEDELSALLKTWKKIENVHMTGAFSHFSSADSDEEFTLSQYEKFQKSVDTIRAYGFSPKTHIAASSAMTDERFSSDMVREGIALYGVGYGILEKQVAPAQKLKTHPVRIEKVESGESIGYSRAYRASSDMTVMTIPCGYGDGYPRILSGRADVLVNGKRAPVIGNICMDMMMADITGIDGVNLDSEVVLMGGQGIERITPGELAERAKTIPYEIMLGFSERVKRSIQ